MEALEANSNLAPPSALKREEEGRVTGHGAAPPPQGFDAGALVLTQPLANGQSFLPNSQIHESRAMVQYQHIPNYHEPRLPNASFPKFDGSHPRVWKEKVEKYFDMFNVPVHRWAQYATIHFKGHAELWLQTYEAQHKIDSWVDLCIVIESKCGKDLYHNSMQELLNIRQTVDVQDYYDRFQASMHRVSVHNSNLDDVFFVSKFLQGLQPDIRAALVLHKPRTVDVALSLALLQAYVLEAQQKTFSRRSHKDFSKYSGKYTPNPQPGVLGATPPDTTKPKWEDKMATMRAQRRAQGLCMKCGEKWGRNHKCPGKISLHVLEELLEIMPTEAPEDDNQSSCDSSSDEEVFALSHCAVVGIHDKKTIRLHGLVKDREILILIDSGSSGTFISDSTVAQLNCPVSTVAPIQVTVANGAKLQSYQMVSNFTWWSLGNTFSNDTRVLTLPYYDLVLGMDWLEKYSPMWIHSKRRLLRFTHDGKRISLTG